MTDREKIAKRYLQEIATDPDREIAKRYLAKLEPDLLIALVIEIRGEFARDYLSMLYAELWSIDHVLRSNRYRR